MPESPIPIVSGHGSNGMWTGSILFDHRGAPSACKQGDFIQLRFPHNPRRGKLMVTAIELCDLGSIDCIPMEKEAGRRPNAPPGMLTLFFENESNRCFLDITPQELFNLGRFVERAVIQGKF